MRFLTFLAAAFISCAAIVPSLSGEADVINVVVRERADGTYLFDVTVQHADEGWEHYANAFEIVGPDGNVLGTRVLAHPHVEEQPFTRSLSRVEIPAGLTEVTVRAVDSVHGIGGKTMLIALPGR
ncbi:MAG: hypothetical protein AAGH82_08765 [Pseudomonadota bacterium]